MDLQLLESIGLTKKEVRIYEVLLKHGEMLPGVIRKKLNFKQATTYKSLYSLEEKGLVVQRKVDGRTTFVPEPPTKILENIQKKVAEEQIIITNLQKILPELTSSYIFSLEKPIITLHNGLTGVQEIFMDILAEEGQLREYYTFDDVDESFLEWIIKYFNPNFYGNGREARLIASDTRWVSQYIQNDSINHKHEFAFLPKEKMELTHSLIIYGDKVIFGNLDVNESILCIRIQHPLIAQTLKSWFDLMWEFTKEIYPLPDYFKTI